MQQKHNNSTCCPSKFKHNSFSSHGYTQSFSLFSCTSITFWRECKFKCSLQLILEKFSKQTFSFLEDIHSPLRIDHFADVKLFHKRRSPTSHSFTSPTFSSSSSGDRHLSLVTDISGSCSHESVRAWVCAVCWWLCSVWRYPAWATRALDKTTHAEALIEACPVARRWGGRLERGLGCCVPWSAATADWVRVSRVYRGCIAWTTSTIVVLSFGRSSWQGILWSSPPSLSKCSWFPFMPLIDFWCASFSSFC